MRLLFLAHQYPPERYGGAERHAHQIAIQLAKDHEVLVYAPAVRHGGRGAAEDIFQGVRVRRWLDRSIGAAPALGRDLLKTAEVFRPDILHIQHAIGLPPRALSELVRRHPAVITLHDYWWMCARIRLMYRGRERCEGPALERCVSCYEGPDAALVDGELLGFCAVGTFGRIFDRVRERFGSGMLSGEEAQRRPSRAGAILHGPRMMRDYFERRARTLRAVIAAARVVISPSRYLIGRYWDAGMLFPARRIEILAYGVNPAEIGEPRTSPVRRPVRFGVIAHPAPEKSVDLAVNAFAAISPEDATLDVWGDPISPAAGEVEEGAVRRRGAFTPAELKSVLSELDVLIVPSLWVENAPKVIHEAFAAGVPVIAASHGALPEFVQEGTTGWLFSVDAPGSLEAVVRRLVDEPVEVERMRERLPRPETVDEVCEKLLAVYRRALAGRGERA